ncbi:MAG TPA: response regulator transcription factor [Roseiflexaceae bacterium]|jgi:DNA-binding response OmpR family regulator|nr:response regulator transcription factor [Roseiflexaceae bacterium]
MIEQGRILLVDDEPGVRMTFGPLLQRAGYAVTVADGGAQAIPVLEQHAFDVLIVDLNMPGMHGLQVAAAARARQPDITTIVLTGHGSLDTALDALHLQVFDYVLKTAEPYHVLQRVNAAVAAHAHKARQHTLLATITSAADTLRVERSAEPLYVPSELESVSLGAIHLDGWRQTVTVGNRTATLTPTEFRVLRCLMDHAGTMISYTELVQCAQGYELGEQEASELVKPHIHHLRHKLEPDPAEPQYILNVRGKGYLLVATGG